MTEPEKILYEALTRAADTLADLAGALRIFGKPDAAEAARTAERDARFALEDSIGAMETAKTIGAQLNRLASTHPTSSAVVD